MNTEQLLDIQTQFVFDTKTIEEKELIDEIVQSKTLTAEQKISQIFG